MAEEPSNVVTLHGVTPEEFDHLWTSRNKERAPADIPDTPFFLDGELIEDSERVPQPLYGPLYATPRIHDHRLVQSVHSEREAMIAEGLAFQVTEEWEGARGFCFPPEHTNTKTVYRTGRNLTGAAFQVLVEARVPDLREFTPSANDVFRSVHACRFAFSMFTGFHFTGSEYFVNFRCDLLEILRPWDLNISSVINWGAHPPF